MSASQRRVTRACWSGLGGAERTLELSKYDTDLALTWHREHTLSRGWSATASDQDGDFAFTALHRPAEKTVTERCSKEIGW